MTVFAGMRCKTGGDYSFVMVPDSSGLLPVYDESGVAQLIPNLGGGLATSDPSKFTLEDGTFVGVPWFSSPTPIPVSEDTSVTAKAGVSRGRRGGV